MCLVYDTVVLVCSAPNCQVLRNAVIVDMESGTTAVRANGRFGDLAGVEELSRVAQIEATLRSAD